jgi:hypothetical protein
VGVNVKRLFFRCEICANIWMIEEKELSVGGDLMGFAFYGLGCTS